MSLDGRCPADLHVNLFHPSNDLSVPDTHRATESGTFSVTRDAYPSRSSLDSPTSLTSFDDVRLTAIPSPGRDPERVPSRYEDNSPLRRSGTALMSVSRKIRRVSVRVVNFAAADHSVRLEDEDFPGEDEEPRKENDSIDSEPAHQTASTTNLGPLRGRTLGFLMPSNTLRLAMYKFLIYKWTEPVILLLIIMNTLVLTIQSASSLFSDDPFPGGALRTWEDIALFMLFIVFSLESLARMAVSGFLLDPEVPFGSLMSAPFGSPFTLSALSSRLGAALSLSHHNVPITDLVPKVQYRHDRQMSSIHVPKQLPFEVAFHVQRSLAHRGVPYLRHSWSRIDFLAVVCFWVHFCLSALGIERTGNIHIGIFRALSVMRTFRLLAVTNGTNTILQSLKVARPLLANVAYFVIFAMILFSIVGVQAFKGSFLRQCVIQVPGAANVTYGQLCGAFIDPVSLNATSFITQAGIPSSSSPRGFVCPLGQICQEQTQNPESGLQAYDNIVISLFQVVIIASVNTWAPIMYSSIDAEFFVSCLFYILGVIVLNFWLINLFVAVITTTFGSIRAKTNKSAFGADMEGMVDLIDENTEERPVLHRNVVMHVYQWTKYLWPLIIVIDVALQASQTPFRSRSYGNFLGEPSREHLVDSAQSNERSKIRTWSYFCIRCGDIVALFGLYAKLAVIQLPPIRQAAFASWLTFFQLARFYRVIMVFPRMRPLIVAVFGNLTGLMNMIVFLLLMVFLSSLVAVQMIRGDMNESINMNFGQIYNAFLAMYQIFSSENWTSVVYDVGRNEAPLRQSIVTTIFLSGWLVFANFIVLQMFVAVLHENIEVAEETAMRKSLKNRNSVQELPKRGPLHWLINRTPLKSLFSYSPSDLDSLDPSPPILGTSKTASEFRQRSTSESHPAIGRHARKHPTTSTMVSSKTATSLRATVSALNKLFTGESLPDDIPLINLGGKEKNPAAAETRRQEMERHLDILASLKRSNTAANDYDWKKFRDHQRKANRLEADPSYDRSLYIFTPANHFRKWCQLCVRPPGGERLFGPAHSTYCFAAFQVILLMAIVAGIVTVAIATPLYRHDYYRAHGTIKFAWFDTAESALALTLGVEFLVKIIADGFIATPNAYIKDLWNFVDFLIMSGLVVNVATTFTVAGGVSRGTRALTALRALRLITLIDNNRLTVQSLMLQGASRIFDAVLLAILYLIPYAVWGINIFQGLMFSCNDPDTLNKEGCTNEFVSNVLDDTNLGFYAPRVWENPHPSTTFSFDNFPSSLLILFEIVSLEGWIDVLTAAVGITGPNQQTGVNASPTNALYFLVFNLFGAVVILTVFLSIIIGNFSRRTGTADLTQEQKDWINLRKLLITQKPSKRPKERPTRLFRAWCYDRAINKKGWWSQGMTCLFVVHIAVLMTQTFSASSIDNTLRDDFFLLVTCIYAVDILVRLYGLGFGSFRANGWNLFDVMTVTGSFATTIPLRFGSTGFATEQAQKLFLVIMAFKLVQRSDRMNQLFKTSRSSLPQILSLLGLWFTLFLFFGILDLEVFGLTRWESAETYQQNFASLGRSLLMLAFMSTGEGWNQYMHDYALTYPRCTNTSPETPTSDCGSIGWAYGLFISWNVVSMYIFANMFTGVVVESFSYVTQMSGAVKAVKRDEMRIFKRTWAEFCNPHSGLLEPQDFTKFFGKLNGIFEVKIYPSAFSVPNLKAACLRRNDSSSCNRGTADELDVRKLKATLSGLNANESRRRREIYNKIVLEANYRILNRDGLTFTDTLLLIAHNKLVDEEKALSGREKHMRRTVKKTVASLYDYDRVRGLFAMAHERRVFLARRTRKSHLDVPAIIVEDLPLSSAWDRTPGTPLSSPSIDYLSDEESSLPSRHSPHTSSKIESLSRSNSLDGNKGNLSPTRLSGLPVEHGTLSSSPTSNSKWGEIMRRASVRISDAPHRSAQYSPGELMQTQEDGLSLKPEN